MTRTRNTGLSDIQDLIDSAAPYNPRQISDDAAAGLRASLSEFGDISGLTYNQRTGHIVAGHQRVEQLAAMGAQIDRTDGQIACVVGEYRFAVRIVDWPLEKEIAANIAANNTHIAGAFTSGLADMLGKVKLGIGDGKFTELRLDKLLSEHNPPPNDDNESDDDIGCDEAGSGQAITKPGDVWTLGRHRFMCGDCTNKSDVARLVESGFEICVTSPPYGISDAARLRDVSKHAKTSLYSLYKDPGHEKWRLLMDSWWSCLSKYWIGAIVNVQLCADNKKHLIGWINNRVDELCDVAVWDKGSGMPASMPGVFNSQFEFMFVFGKQGLRRVPLSGWHANKANVFKSPKMTGVSAHRARMPLAVAEWMVDLCDMATKFCDPFGGTGTTMMAADARDKICMSMELDPKYCDIAVERWEQETGGKAKREQA